jgi:hypothetical protein
LLRPELVRRPSVFLQSTNDELPRATAARNWRRVRKSWDARRGWRPASGFDRHSEIERSSISTTAHLVAVAPAPSADLVLRPSCAL